jgi:hypothetical protein
MCQSCLLLAPAPCTFKHTQISKDMKAACSGRDARKAQAKWTVLQRATKQGSRTRTEKYTGVIEEQNWKEARALIAVQQVHLLFLACPARRKLTHLRGRSRRRALQRNEKAGQNGTNVKHHDSRQCKPQSATCIGP